MDEKFIEIDKVFKDKNPKLYKFLPRFILSYIKNTIHQEEMNDVISAASQMKGIEFATHLINDIFKVKVTYQGLENVPKEGGGILISNHPLGGLDGITLTMLVGKHRPDIQFIVNDLLMRIPNFRDVFTPVNKLGVNPKESLIRIEREFASEKLVMIFPAGLCSRKQDDGTIKDLEWTKSFIAKSRKYNHPIVPCHFEGKNSNWFYNLARFRKKVNIKANIEMFFLPDEMFKQSGKSVHITFGKPVYPQDLPKSFTDQELANQFKRFVYHLKENPNADFLLYLNKNN